MKTQEAPRKAQERLR